MVRIPEIIHHHAEIATDQNISYLEFLDKLLQEEIMVKRDRSIRMKTCWLIYPTIKRWNNSISFSSTPLMKDGFVI